MGPYGTLPFHPILDTVEQLTGYLTALRPFTPPSVAQPGMISSKDPKQAAEDFLQQIHQQQQRQEDESLPISRQSILDELDETNVMHMTSVLRKRRIKMKKHKYKKLRKRTRALRKKLGK